ncbi:hypothetical protein GVO57_11070 [Sphingomonas changnyeongensis]|uniref:Uncharacterized protein n=1 Tax=Sphingomonas changnyeongensis TaxID=2698679 RepID=A0A7Z2NWW9_9SPHN|nr:hypothetical protein [Sphingomonas changnyeongensis]QHL91252.1 hypothetical protein GVO57_11070 [Sphingomonas changnyeongensis]
MVVGNRSAAVPARADGRPRIHLRATRSGARFRHGATGIDHDAASLGEAVERALEAIGGRDAVIIFSGEQNA